METVYPPYIFSEQDLKAWIRLPKNRLKPILSTAYFGLFGVGLIAVWFVIINLEAFVRINDLAAINAQNATPEITQVIATSTPVLEENALIEESDLQTNTQITPSIPDNTLVISDLKISVPVTWKVKNQTDTINAGLANGVIHLQGTALPGEIGTSVISGHSSDLPWHKGNYKTVFAPLLDAKIGQVILLSANNQVFSYKITKKYEVGATDQSVLKQTSNSTLRLVTCTPLGTDWRRAVIEAELQ